MSTLDHTGHSHINSSINNHELAIVPSPLSDQKYNNIKAIDSVDSIAELKSPIFNKQFPKFDEIKELTRNYI